MGQSESSTGFLEGMMCLRTEFRRGAAELVQAHNEAVLFSAFSCLNQTKK